MRYVLIILFLLFTNLHTAQAALVGWWKMDEWSWNGTANEVVDSSGSGNHGTASGGATTKPGKDNRAGYFDGSDDYIQLNSSPMSTSQANAHTVSLWYKWEDCPSGYCNFIGQAMSLNDNYLYLLINEAASRLYNWKKSYAALPAIWNDGNWHFVVYVHPAGGDGSTDEFYFDNTKLTTIDDSGTWTEQTTTWRIGINSDGGDGQHPFKGFLDDVRIYNEALSADTIAQHYNEGIHTRIRNATLK